MWEEDTRPPHSGEPGAAAESLKTTSRPQLAGYREYQRPPEVVDHRRAHFTQDQAWGRREPPPAVDPAPAPAGLDQLARRMAALEKKLESLIDALQSGGKG